MAFLVFEGLDASGKSTLMEALHLELGKRGQEVLISREPGGVPLSEELRPVLLRRGQEAPCPRTEILLYEACRAQHVDSLLKPALDQGKWVICDRYYASTVAFQAYARGLERKSVDWLNNFAVDGIHPDLTVLLDISVEDSQQRLSCRGDEKDRLEGESLDFHERVRQGYLEQAQDAAESWLVLDARKPLEDLLAAVMRDLLERKWLES